MFGYVTSLRTMSSGRASSTMEFSHYEQPQQRDRSRFGQGAR
jgi:elongation factor G